MSTSECARMSERNIVVRTRARRGDSLRYFFPARFRPRARCTSRIVARRAYLMCSEIGDGRGEGYFNVKFAHVSTIEPFNRANCLHGVSALVGRPTNKYAPRLIYVKCTRSLIARHEQFRCVSRGLLIVAHAISPRAIVGVLKKIFDRRIFSSLSLSSPLSLRPSISFSLALASKPTYVMGRQVYKLFCAIAQKRAVK